MGALTNKRKREDDCFKSVFSPSSPIDQSGAFIDRKPKISVSPAPSNSGTSRPGSSDSIFSKVNSYPEKKSGFVRAIHAPVSNSRLRPFSWANKSETAAGSKESPGMGKLFHRLIRYENARAAAHASLRHTKVPKEKKREIIELDDSDDENRDDVTADSSIEVVKNVGILGSKRMRPLEDSKDSPEFDLKTTGKEVRSLNSSVVTDSSNGIAKMDDGGKTVIKLSGQGEGDSDLPYYKRLHNEVIKKSDPVIGFLTSTIDFLERRRISINIFRPKKKEEPIKKDVTTECFVALTEEEESEVSNALSYSNRRKVVVSHEGSNIDITGEKLQCLKPGAWLNDEAINLYLELLKEREKREPGKFLKCHFFNTFFYKKLISGRDGYNYQSVRRWTTQRKLGYNLLDCDKIFVPIHKGNHWCLAVINKKDEMFQYLDSLKGFDCHVLNVLAKYFVDEVKDKCGKVIDVSSWEKEYVTDLPEQLNGYDCGVFMIKYADFYSRDIGLCFSQDHMPYFRLRTVKEILKLRAE